MHQLFIDFKHAYDSVRMEVLYNILIEFGIPMKLVRLIKVCLTKKYSRVRVGTNLSDMFPIRNGLKKGDVLLLLLFNFILVCAIKRVQVSQNGLKLNGTHHLLVYADVVNILGGSVHTRNYNAEALIVISKEIGLELNAERSRRRWEDNINMDNISMDNITMDLQKVEYTGMDWIELAQYGDRLRVLLNAVTKLRVPKMRRISRLVDSRLFSQEGLYSKKEVSKHRTPYTLY